MKLCSNASSSTDSNPDALAAATANRCQNLGNGTSGDDGGGHSYIDSEPVCSVMLQKINYLAERLRSSDYDNLPALLTNLQTLAETTRTDCGDDLRQVVEAISAMRQQLASVDSHVHRIETQQSSTNSTCTSIDSVTTTSTEVAELHQRLAEIPDQLNRITGQLQRLSTLSSTPTTKTTLPTSTSVEELLKNYTKAINHSIDQLDSRLTATCSASFTSLQPLSETLDQVNQKLEQISLRVDNQAMTGGGVSSISNKVNSLGDNLYTLNVTVDDVMRKLDSLISAVGKIDARASVGGGGVQSCTTTTLTPNDEPSTHCTTTVTPTTTNLTKHVLPSSSTPCFSYPYPTPSPTACYNSVYRAHCPKTSFPSRRCAQFNNNQNMLRQILKS